MSARKTPSSDFRKILESISHRYDSRRVFDGFTRLAACALAAQTREAEYLEEARVWEKPDLDSFGMALGALVMEMETRPFEDILGGYYMECAISAKGQQWNGEFHTPKCISDLMARLTLGDVESLPNERLITVCEPACGAGAMILSVAQACTPEVCRRLRVTAIDINRTACDMAFVNTTLWLAKQGQTGAPVDPIARQRVQEHMALHFQYLKQTDPEAAKQLAQQIAAAAGPGNLQRQS